MHLNTDCQYNNSLLRVGAGGLLLGFGNLQDDFSLLLDSKIGPSVSEGCYNLAQFYIFLGAFTKFAKSN
jgi:hypothetical protein